MTPEQIGEYLEHQGATDDEIDEFLEHFGVKGMKWGQRKAARQRNRELNKASREKDKAAYIKEIEKARAEVKSGKVKADYKAVKANYKQKKTEVGSREAKKILNAAKEKQLQKQQTARLAKNGKEAAGILAATMGAYIVSDIVLRKLASP